jgi:phosphoribosyl-ATP pyrophosphohydrolase
MLTINAADIPLYEQALKTWGRELQLGMVTEECAELIVAIQHYKRNRVGGSKVLREVADVIVVLEQLMVVLAADHGCPVSEVAVDVAYMAEHSRNKLRDWLAKENIHDYQ